MKSKKLLLFFVMLCCLLFVGCNNTTDTESKPEEKIDYSKYSFTDVSWTRDAGHDTETIRFNSDGTFSYSCGCGNPVNDSDLCEGYTYDDETKAITLDCLEETNETVTTIKIIKSEEQELQLDFDGEVRIFVK